MLMLEKKTTAKSRTQDLFCKQNISITHNVENAAMTGSLKKKVKVFSIVNL